MKSNGLRKAAAAALAGTMALSLASCMLFGPNKQEIIDAADEFAGALLKQDAGKIIKLTNEKKDSDAAEALDIMFDSSMYTDEQNKFIDAVSDTISYEIDEKSVQVSKEEASVDVVFTMVDYEKALDDDLSDIDAVLDAIDDCDDTQDIEITFEFEKDDDAWLLTNINDKGFGKLFDYYLYELNLTPALASLIDEYDCYGGSSYVYFDVFFTDDISDYDGLFTFDVYYEGQLIDPDEEAYVYDTYIWCEYYGDDSGEVPAGEYTLVLKYDDVEIVSGSTEIEENAATPTETYSGGVHDDLTSLVQYVDWWADDGYGVYTDTAIIEYDIFFSDELTYDDVVSITFNIYDESGATIGENLSVYGSNISGVTDDDGNYYTYLAYDNGSTLEPGTYYIEVFNPDGSTLLTDYCVVE